MPSGSTRVTVASLYSFPSMVLKSSASASDADSAAKITRGICQYFMQRILPVCSTHGNAKVIYPNRNDSDDIHACCDRHGYRQSIFRHRAFSKRSIEKPEKESSGVRCVEIHLVMRLATAR